MKPTDEALLLAQMEDLSHRAGRTGMAHGKFLTPAEGAAVQDAYKNRRDVSLLLEGGFAAAERRVPVFLQPDWGAWTPGEVLAGLRIEFRAQDALSHRDILGAIVGLGLSRDVLGDIMMEPGCAFAACLCSMADFIARELDKAGRVGVKAYCIPPEELPQRTPALRLQQATVASLRLDAALAEAFHLSRGAAAEAIRAGKVQLAHRECLDTAHTVRQGDILSLRGRGRVQLLEVQDLSRKGRQRILLGYFE